MYHKRYEERNKNKSAQDKYEYIIAGILSIIAYPGMLVGGYFYLINQPSDIGLQAAYGSLAAVFNFVFALSFLFLIFNIILLINAKMDQKAPLRKLNIAVGITAIFESLFPFWAPILSSIMMNS